MAHTDPNDPIFGSLDHSRPNWLCESFTDAAEIREACRPTSSLPDELELDDDLEVAIAWLRDRLGEQVDPTVGGYTQRATAYLGGIVPETWAIVRLLVRIAKLEARVQALEGQGDGATGQ